MRACCDLYELSSLFFILHYIMCCIILYCIICCSCCCCSFYCFFIIFSTLDRKLTSLQACTNLVDILKLHGYYKVKEMPPDFVNACNNLYPYSSHITPSSFYTLPLSLSLSPSPSLPPLLLCHMNNWVDRIQIFILQMLFWPR